MTVDSGEIDPVCAAIADLAPVIFPGAVLSPAGDELVVPLRDGRARIGITRLVDACRQVGHQQWPQLISTWLEAARAQVLDAAPVCAGDLRVRLGPVDDALESIVGAITAPFGPGLTLVLLAEQPAGRRVVTEAVTEHLGLDQGAALSAGLANTIRSVLAPLDVRRHELPGGLSMLVGAADDVPYVSAALTSIPQVFRLGDAPHGAFVAAPRFSTVICHPVTSKRSVAVVPVLRALIADMYRDATDPCSPALWWWHDRQFHQLAVGDDGKVEFPATLEGALDALPAG